LDISPLLFVFVPALSLSLGWGIRGQYGGQRGALIAGALFGLALGVVSGHSSPMRFAAVAAVAMSFGGAMTYGQTIGLTHDEPRSPTYWLGMTGLAVKGVVWMGNAGVWIGIASGYAMYAPVEVVLLAVGQFLLGLAGVGLLNRPHDPPERLPRIYFSKRYDEKPRVEWWGGLLVGYIGLLLYAFIVKHDVFAAGLGLFGAVGGFGFPLGQSVQAWARYREPFGRRVQRWCDWWKAMELTFGFVAGATIAFGWWVLTALGLEPLRHTSGTLPLGTLPFAVEVGFVAAYVAVFVASVLRVRFVTVALLAPYAEGLFLLTPALTGRFAGLGILLGVTGAVAAIQNARRFYADRLVTPRIAAVVAVVGTDVCVLACVPFAGSARSLFLALVWIQTLSTVTWSAMTPVLKPSPELVTSRGRLRATLSEWGSAFVVETIFVIFAVVLTLLVGTVVPPTGVTVLR
jgi:hypothetical protein